MGLSTFTPTRDFECAQGQAVAFTFFFRDAQTLELLIEQSLPTLCGQAFIRIWDAGCAHGPEPYTLAMLLRERLNHAMKAVIRDGPPVSGHKPSVDVMMVSAAEIFGSGCLGVIMTGMGHDGAAGCGAIRAAGGYVLGQNEATSDVYGMNKVAFIEGNVDRQFGLSDSAATIARHARPLSASASRI
jgi:hypothetical protein